MSLPVLYEADTSDLRAAIERIRDRLGELRQPRLYAVAVALTILARQGRATPWLSWDSAPPSSAKRFGRPDVVWAMWQLFGAPTKALIKTGSSVDMQLRQPPRVLLDVLYGANGPLTLVAPARIENRRDAVKLTLTNPSWIWSDQTSDSTSSTSIAEYNPVNSINQQNGIGCAFPAAAAVEKNPDSPGAVYGVSRAECPHRKAVVGKEPTCSLNGAVCGGQGDGAERATTKPRLLAPPAEGSDAYVVLPNSISKLVELATAGGHLLPAADDLSLLVSWCHTGGSGIQDAARLPILLGAEGLRLLTSPA